MSIWLDMALNVGLRWVCVMCKRKEDVKINNIVGLNTKNVSF